MANFLYVIAFFHLKVSSRAETFQDVSLPIPGKEIVIQSIGCEHTMLPTTWKYYSGEHHFLPTETFGCINCWDLKATGYKQLFSYFCFFFFSGKDELTVLHASQCTALPSCSSVMDKDQDKGWMTTIFEWLRRYYMDLLPR